MKMEQVYEALKEWGEIIITTAAGTDYELHLGDTHFDFDNRLITLHTNEAQYIIDGDAVDSITKHYGHRG